MNEEIVIVARDRDELMELAVAFRGLRYQVTVSEADVPVKAATRLAWHAPTAMIVALEGNENVVDMRTLLSATRATSVLFLAPAMPPSAALARIAHTSGAEIIAADEPSVVIVATLVAMLSRARGAVS